MNCLANCILYYYYRYIVNTHMTWRYIVRNY